jgi:hypothetical protein
VNQVESMARIACLNSALQFVTATRKLQPPERIRVGKISTL